MFHNTRTTHIASLIGLIVISLIGCQMFERHAQSPTTPARRDSSALSNYAQMEDGSTVVDGQQINWVVSEWGSLPYGYWMYVEVNQQDAVGKHPGENQVPVTLGNVVLSFSELPDEVTQIIIGVKAVHDDNDDTFTEIGQFPVEDGSINIPLEYTDLIYYFGITHYSIWFQAIGGKNEEGTACGTIALSGVMPSGQNVNLSKRICFGTNPEPTSTPTSTSTPPPPPPVTAIVMYNAGPPHDGNLGGRSGADALCLAAKPASLPASYTNVHAFISIQPGDAIRDLPIPTNRPIASVGGTTIFTNRTDMLDGDNPATSLLAAGVTPTNTQWWSGSGISGQYDPAGFSNCDHWTRNDLAAEFGRYGIPDPSPVQHWMGDVHTSCNLNLYVLCITYEP